MELEKYNEEDIAEVSLLKVATEILTNEKKAMDFNELFNRVAEFKGLTDQQKEEVIAQFYTDLNTDGQFMTVGSNMWGLKRWYPVDQIEEDVAPKKKKKKKAKKKPAKKEVVEEVEEKEVEEDLTEDFDDFEEDLDEDFGFDAEDIDDSSDDNNDDDDFLSEDDDEEDDK
ncbi:DNA-directed RNA polymerase subunit delta [Salinibacillus xinjiangensis]|uniref:Probable DNA-directed RNA polymerase subunit delta n=1 Tax=Salinibacillus xinjiangensis TaxID=1229268 RepID=A0A6G1X5Y8_9BACI|nr:DNA-directed RNA polymerase subunit delta [Salinibacillus xinjiangensis]